MLGRERHAVVYQDLRALADLYARRQPDEAEFEALRSAGLAMDLDHDEFAQMIGKYGEVLAVRIHGRRPGVLAVDVAWDHYANDGGGPPSAAVLRNDELEQMLQRSASDPSKSLATL